MPIAWAYWGLIAFIKALLALVENMTLPGTRQYSSEYPPRTWYPVANMLLASVAAVLLLAQTDDHSGHDHSAPLPASLQTRADWLAAAKAAGKVCAPHPPLHRSTLL